MNVAIVGSREWRFPIEIRSVVASLAPTDVLVSGGARGVDSIAEHYARKRGLECIIHEADWELFGKSAGFIRNRLIVRDADRLIAFQHEHSRGTQHTIDLALDKGIRCKIYSYTKAHGMQVM